MRKLSVLLVISVAAVILVTGCNKKSSSLDDFQYNVETQDINDVISPTKDKSKVDDNGDETSADGTTLDDKDKTISSSEEPESETEKLPQITGDVMYSVGIGALFKDMDLNSFSPCVVDESINSTLTVIGELGDWYKVFYKYQSDAHKDMEGDIWYVPKAFVSKAKVTAQFYTVYPCIIKGSEGQKQIGHMWWYESEDDEDTDSSKSFDVYDSICSQYGYVNPVRTKSSGTMNNTLQCYYYMY